MPAALAIRSAAVGADLGSRTFEVTPRMLLAYAAALGATGEATFDDAAPGGLTALPQFCVVLEWPLASDPGLRQRIGITPEVAQRGLHLGQDSTFHRPMRAGDRLRVSGRLVEVRAIRTGALTVSRIDTVCAASGDPVVTTWSTGLFTGVAVDGADQASERRPAAEPGDTATVAPQVTVLPVARELPHVYSECSGIWNPIHTERRVALAFGLPDIILHGTATWAIAGRELLRVYGSDEPARLLRLAGDFRAMVIPGTTIALEHAVLLRDPTAIRFSVTNHLGEVALANGIAAFGPAGG